MTLEEYEIELKKHDWYYMMSDSMKVFDKGERNQKYLTRLAKENGQEFVDLLNEYTRE